jgi:tetratricopeptide (TPR) repeat protein
MTPQLNLQTATLTRLEELQRRVRRDPASISFAALAEEYRRLGMFQEAADVCRAGLLRHPSYLSARVTLGRALLELGDFDGATSELERVLQHAPENLAAIRALAELHRRLAEMPEPMEVDEPVPNVQHESIPEFGASKIVPFVALNDDDADDARVIAGLESFLTAIQRARRELAFPSAR